MRFSRVRVPSIAGLLSFASLACVAVGAASAALAGCSADAASVEASDQDLAQSATAEWFYGGPLPALDQAQVFVSLTGNTARVSGLLPVGVTLTETPAHVRTKAEGSRVRVDAVYPIASARVLQGKENATPGTYKFNNVIPYRPDGTAVTAQEGEHMVTWGGFPFLRYDGGIALHGPITHEASKSGGTSVWYLQRGKVSGGCNRMMGEHVVELAHVAGIDMRKLYTANATVNPPRQAKVTVLADYDQYDDGSGAGLKYVDSDYPTNIDVPAGTEPMVRPGKAFGDDKVAMFGSWVASETPTGADLPRDFKFQGGVAGKPYVFAEHAKQTWVCSALPADLPRLAAFARANGGSLPAGFCAKKACVLGALAGGADPKSSCGL
jgi:hypothetical protein